MVQSTLILLALLSSASAVFSSPNPLPAKIRRHPYPSHSKKNGSALAESPIHFDQNLRGAGSDKKPLLLRKRLSKRSQRPLSVKTNRPDEDCDHSVGAWEGKEWRSSYYDSGHSQQWNFARGFTNFDGSQYAWAPSTNLPTTSIAASFSSSSSFATLSSSTPANLSTASNPQPTSSDVNVTRLAVDEEERQNKTTSSSSPKHSGLTGFIEIATRVKHTALTKSVSGLTYDADEKNGTLVLSMSESRGSSFTVVPISSMTTSIKDDQNGDFVNDFNQDSVVTRPIVQLQVRFVNPETEVMERNCVTFSTTPLQEMTMELCGKIKDGHAQSFAYDGNSGELAPLWVDLSGPIPKTASAVFGGDVASHHVTTMPALAEGAPTQVFWFFMPANDVSRSGRR